MNNKSQNQIVSLAIDQPKLSWEETFKEMAQEDEEWQDLENTILDGLETVNAQHSPVINYGLKA